MYEIQIPVTIHLITALFYQLGLWYKREPTIRERRLQKFSFIYSASFAISIALGAYTTDDEDERVFLTVCSTVGIVQVYRMWCIIRKGNGIFKHDNVTHYTNDRQEFIQVNKELQFFMKFPKYFAIMCFSSFVLAIAQPIIANEKRPFINVAFPLDRFNSATAFLLKHLFISMGMNLSGVSCCLTLIVWYLMFSIVMKYKMLGNQFRNMGKTERKVSMREQRTLYVKDFTAAIRNYERINGYEALISHI